MVIRILLVEADDSTRQIIAALLRKCNYKVAAIPDGLKAWEILKQKHSNIDLILTEVDLPSISGYALLTLIMEHDSCKNIPVIMMSSSDSISMVFKCMLKGAADFLIKPVRRNELKNLWQHVWRRISANNASGVQNLHGRDCKPETSSRSRATKNCLDDNVSSSKDKSQSTEKAIDAQMKPHGAFNLSQNEVQHHEKGKRLGEKTEKGKSTRSEPSSIAHSDEAYPLTSRPEQVGSSSGKMDQAQTIEPASCRNIDAVSSKEPNEHVGQAIDLIGTINNQLECNRQQFTSSCEIHNSSATQLELSLRRFSDPEEQKTDGKQRLNHSNASAFSRYNSSSKKLRTLFPSLVNNPTEAEGGDKFHEEFLACPKPANTLRMDEENKITAMTSPAAHPVPIFPGPRLGLVPAPVVELRGTCSGYGPIYPPVFNPQPSRGAIGLKLTKQKESSPILASTSLHSDPGTYCSSLGHSGFDETSKHEEKVVSVDQQKHTDGEAASQSGNSAVCSNGIAALLHNNVINDTTNQAMLGTGNTEEVHVRDNGGNTMTSDQFARAKSGFHNSEREAALAKFRQKRKDRCFEKKVRYQSRKKLAEQRPRVKGQFVRQVQSDRPLADSDTPGHEDNG
ncbi:hypothetical protein V2J09_024338 [Rumex salicifolius]